MTGAGRRPRTLRIVLAVVLFTVLVVLGRAVMVTSGEQPQAVELVLILLTSSLTIIALVLTLAYDPSASWPSLQMVVGSRLVQLWAAGAVLSIVLLAVPSSAFAAVQDLAVVSAIDGFTSRVLGSAVLAPALAPASALWSGVMTFLLGGVVAIKLLLEAGGRAGRTALALQLVRASSGDADAHRHRLRGFRSSIQIALADGDAEVLNERMQELCGTAELLGRFRRNGPEVARSLLTLDLALISDLRRSVVASDGMDPVALSTAFTELTRAASYHAGYLMRARAAPSADDTQVQRCELMAGVFLGALARHLAWTAIAALDRDGSTGEVDDRLVASLVEASEASRRLLLQKIDPDPPGVYLPVEDPWQRGLREPEAASAFLWGMGEPHTYLVGSTLYAYVEILTGQKFAHSFSESDVCMLTEIATRIGDGGGDDPHLARSAEHLRAVGGVRRISADLLVSLLASWSRPVQRLPRTLQGDVRHELPSYRRAKQVRWFTLREPVRLAGVDEGMTELAQLLAAGDADASDGGFHGWARRTARMHGVRSAGVPAPLPSERPAAATLAVALRLMPLESDGGRRAVERFVRQVPEVLVDAAVRLTDTWGLEALHRSGPIPDAPTPAEQRRLLLDRLSFVHETEI